jgi:hypothetical protein
VPTSGYAALIDSLDTRNIQDFQEWMMYGGLDYTLYDNLTELLNSNSYNTLLENEGTAAYAAYLNSNIATAIKNNSTYLRKALLCSYNYMFFDSRFDFDENIDNLVEKNPVVSSDYRMDIVTPNDNDNPRINGWLEKNGEIYSPTYDETVNEEKTYYIANRIVTYSADRCSNPIVGEIDDSGYYGYMAFNGSHDTNDTSKVYAERNIWSAFGANQWVQYKYNEPKYLCYIKVYSIRDNAPIGIVVEGSNDGENFTLIKQQDLSGTIGFDHYDKVMCQATAAYQYFRFTITDSVYEGTCNVCEIEIYTYK